MKKSVLILIIFSVTLLFGACSISADQMLDNFNDELYEDKGDGVFEKPNGVSVDTRIIPRSVYSIFEYSSFEMKISEKYLEYKWTITDKENSKEYDIPNGYYRVVVDRSILDFIADRDYILTVIVKDLNGKLYTDSATIKVKKNN